MRKMVLAVVVLVGLGLVLRPLGGAVPTRLSVSAPAVLERRGPVTVLVLGLDQRGSEVARTDTIFVVQIGAAGRPTSVLSIPRDLWVPIPGRGEDRINTAHVWGDLQDGNGVGLTRRTIEQNFGVRIDRAVVVDFACFEKLVDSAGGVPVQVPRRIVDESFPGQDGGPGVIRFEPGLERMTGSRALQYVRTRASDSDFGRIRRQQQVVGALAERMRDPGIAVRVARAFLGCGGSGTDLNPTDLVSLGAIAAGSGAPRVALIDETMVNATTLPSGAQVLVPRWDRIRPLIGEMFGAGPFPNSS